MPASPRRVESSDRARRAPEGSRPPRASRSRKQSTGQSSLQRAYYDYVSMIRAWSSPQKTPSIPQVLLFHGVNRCPGGFANKSAMAHSLVSCKSDLIAHNRMPVKPYHLMGKNESSRRISGKVVSMSCLPRTDQDLRLRYSTR